MKFLILVIDSQTETASSDEIQAIDEFNDLLQQNNHWITAGGINHGTAATTIDNRLGADIVTPGSIHNAPEHYSGFWLIEAADDKTALGLAKQGSKACNRKVELRPFLR